MNALSRWNPFNTTARLDPFADIDDMVRSFAPIARRLDAAPSIAMDVSEDAGSFTVKAEIPGVDKKDIDVSIDGNLVAISAEVRKESEKKQGEKVVHSERYFGRACRSFTLPSDVDASKANAAYDKGVLTLTLPKSPNGKTRRIDVK